MVSFCNTNARARHPLAWTSLDHVGPGTARIPQREHAFRGSFPAKALTRGGAGELRRWAMAKVRFPHRPERLRQVQRCSTSVRVFYTPSDGAGLRRRRAACKVRTRTSLFMLQKDLLLALAHRARKRECSEWKIQRLGLLERKRARRRAFAGKLSTSPSSPVIIRTSLSRAAMRQTRGARAHARGRFHRCCCSTSRSSAGGTRPDPAWVLPARGSRKRFKRAGKTALLITHDLLEAVTLSDRVLVMRPARPGRIIDEIRVELPQREDPIRAPPRHPEVNDYVGAADGSARHPSGR